MNDLDFGGKPFRDLNSDELAQLDAHDWTAEQIMTALSMALKVPDLEAAVELLGRLARKDPLKASAILAVIESL